MKKIISETPFQIIQRRNRHIISTYKLHQSLLPRPGIDLQKIRTDEFCRICINLLLDPDSLFTQTGKQILLPKEKSDFEQMVISLHQKADPLSSKQQIGERLRHYRQLCGLTGKMVANMWNQYSINDTTQATISNHEKAKYGDIRLSDIITYINIYNSVVPINPQENEPVLPGNINVDDVLFGCSFFSLLDSLPLFTEYRNQLSSTNEDKLTPADDVSFDESSPDIEIESNDSLYSQAMLRVLLLQLSKGLCECCEQPAPFKDKDNIPYLELHRIDSTKANDPSNYVVVCPNCHRKIHCLNDDHINAVLQQKAAQHSLSSLFHDADQKA